MTGGTAATAGPGLVVHVADLVLVREAGQALAELVAPLASQLAAHGVPDALATAAATAIVDQATGQVTQ